MAGTIMDFITGFGKAAKRRRVDGALKNYLTDPQAAIEAVNNEDPRLAIQLSEQQKAQVLAAEKAAHDKEDHVMEDAEAIRSRYRTAQMHGARMIQGAFTRTKDMGKAVDLAAPMLMRGFGLTEDEVADLRTRAVNDPSMIEALAADPTKAPTVPEAYTLRPGEKRFGADNVLVADAPFKPQAPMKVSPGQMVIDVGDNASEVTPTGPEPVAGSGRTFDVTGKGIETIAMTAVPGLPTPTSRGRSAADNKRVGGQSDSYHLTDQARDFVPPQGMGMGQLYAKLRAAYPKEYDVINEGDHIHVEPGPALNARGKATATLGGGGGTRTAGGRVLFQAPPAPEKDKTNNRAQYRPLSSAEKQQYGIAPEDGSYQINSDGKISRVATPVSSPTSSKARAGGDLDAKARAAAEGAVRQLADMRKSVIGILNHPGLQRATGSLQGRLPSFSQTAQDFDSEVDNLKNQIVIKVLSQLKALSATGASGFGSLTEKEGQRLENSISSLDQRQSEEQFKKNLNSVLSWVDQGIRDGKARLGQGAAPTNSTHPVGTVAKLKDGSRVRWNGTSWQKVR